MKRQGLGYCKGTWHVPVSNVRETSIDGINEWTDLIDLSFCFCGLSMPPCGRLPTFKVLCNLFAIEIPSNCLCWPLCNCSLAQASRSGCESEMDWLCTDYYCDSSHGSLAHWLCCHRLNGWHDKIGADTQWWSATYRSIPLIWLLTLLRLKPIWQLPRAKRVDSRRKIPNRTWHLRKRRGNNGPFKVNNSPFVQCSLARMAF